MRVCGCATGREDGIVVVVVAAAAAIVAAASLPLISTVFCGKWKHSM
jgi:hypothetical protein